MSVSPTDSTHSVSLTDLETAILTHYIITSHITYKDVAEDIIVNKLKLNISNGPDSQNILKSQLSNISSFPFSGPLSGEEKFTFIDLFAGIGGFRIAMQAHGGQCLFSSEWDKYSQQTYYNNYGEVPFGDITKDEIKAFIPKKFNILCAGFPCQPFSRAGVSARNFLGLEHGFDHPTQGNLFFDIIEIARLHEPDVLFLENVKNLKSHDKGNTFVIIERMIRDIGYSFDSTVINASSLVPQRRERTYMVCFKDKSIKFDFPQFKGEPKKLRTILESDVPETYTISDKLWLGHQVRTKKNLERGVGFTAFLADLDKPSNTLVARYGKDGKECLIPQEGKNPRKLTPRECARLQGYPENFTLPTSNAAAYRQFGNSVAVPIVSKIGKMIVEHLLKAK
ncbi:MAG: cytosine methyltransferase [Sphingobacteriales bacterium]|nr:cytosine methyltransferase [Sphingobacteriales bacterium]